MTQKPNATSGTRNAVIVFGLIAVFLALNAIKAAPHGFDILMAGDNDDIIRWLSVKAWLNGQGWFDMTQYRLFAPQGLAMHWSRYVDAAIAGLYILLGFGLSSTDAAQWTLVLWPLILLVLVLLVAAVGAGKLFGPSAAIIAMVVVITWMPIREIAFAHGRIDHHNIQILLISLLALTMIQSNHAFLWGTIAGGAGAASLAVGLETLPFIGMAGIILALRASWAAPGADARLIGFCTMLLSGSALLFIGQTAPGNWGAAHCDVMSIPAFALMLVASGASLAPVALKQYLPTPFLRISVTVGLTLLGLALFAPVLRPCFGGPYGALPPEVLTLIKTKISEAQPALVFMATRPWGAVTILLPLLLGTGLATFFWLRNPTGRNAAQRAAIWQMLVFGWLGVFASLSQIRLNMLAAPAVPFLIAYVLVELSALHHRRPSMRAKLGLATATVLTLFTQTLTVPLAAYAAATDPAVQSHQDDDCRNSETLSALDTLPTASILTTLNLGAPLLFATHHTAVAAPYHRDPQAFWNGDFPFRDAH